jgi:hypothetical protein
VYLDRRFGDSELVGRFLGRAAEDNAQHDLPLSRRELLDGRSDLEKRAFDRVSAEIARLPGVVWHGNSSKEPAQKNKKPRAYQGTGRLDASGEE